MADFNQIKVLIVDDDLDIRKIIKSVLTAMGVKDISEAVNGREAYDILKVPPSAVHGRRKKFDLIICDWAMPVMTGIELLEKIRKDTFLRRTVFVMATAENDRENIVKAVEGDVDDYIVKPFSASVLEQTLRRASAKIK